MKRILFVAAAFLCMFAANTSAATDQSILFTYQGKLSANGQPANGNFDMTFRVYDAVTSGNPVGSAITPLAGGTRSVSAHLVITRLR